MELHSGLKGERVVHRHSCMHGSLPNHQGSWPATFTPPKKAQTALEIAKSLEHPPSIAYATFWLGWVHHACDEFALACVPLETSMTLGRKYGLPQFLEWSRVLYGSCLAECGGRSLNWCKS